MRVSRPSFLGHIEIQHNQPGPTVFSCRISALHAQPVQEILAIIEANEGVGQTHFLERFLHQQAIVGVVLGVEVRGLLLITRPLETAGIRKPQNSKRCAIRSKDHCPCWRGWWQWAKCTFWPVD
jgi:hypothetical protein